MALSSYHQKYAARLDEELARRAMVKRDELARIFKATKYIPQQDPVRVAVLGCADRRFVAHHRRVFESLLKKQVELTTFDIAIEHLKGEEGVIQHDCTLPFPSAPYDITFSHVLLKFIEIEKQWDVIRNSYDALRPSGLAIHVFDTEDVTATSSPRQADGYFSVPLDRWKKKLADEHVKFLDLRWTISVDGPKNSIRGVKGGALVLLKS